MGVLKVAVATVGYEGLSDRVASELARCPTLTIFEVDEERRSYRLLEVVENKVAKFSQGAGPIFVYTLAEKGVEVVLGPGVGMGVADLLAEAKIKFVKCEPGIKVEEALNSALQ